MQALEQPDEYQANKTHARARTHAYGTQNHNQQLVI